MHGGKSSTGHPEIWALLTIVTFPIVLIASELLGAGGWWPFLYAVIATFSILVLEAIVRGRLWPFEQGFVDHIGHPETPYRILVFLSATLLILETVLIVGVATDPRFDAPVLGLVIRKQCALRETNKTAATICAFLTEERKPMDAPILKADLAKQAIQAHASKTWIPNGVFVTCATRRVMRNLDESTYVRELDLIHCTDWKIDDQRVLRPTKSRSGYAAVLLAKNANGLYSVSSWTEDPQSPVWDSTLGDIAPVARERVNALEILPELITALQGEALGKAQTLLKL